MEPNLKVIQESLPSNIQFIFDKQNRLSLIDTNTKSPSPVNVDFQRGRLGYRSKRGGKELLIKAIGGPNKKVLDTTAGLATDAFVMALHGCQVTAVEKHPAIAALVFDAIKRAKGTEAESILKNITYINGNSDDYITSQNWDVIYADPMFPPTDNPQMRRKEMVMLAQLAETYNPTNLTNPHGHVVQKISSQQKAEGQIYKGKSISFVRY